jgi:hypothetical protein
MLLRMQREKSSITRGTFERGRNVREYATKLEDGIADDSEEDSGERGYFFCLKMSILRRILRPYWDPEYSFVLFLGDNLLICNMHIVFLQGHRR